MTNNPLVRMLREPDLDVVDPSMDDVRDLMNSVSIDEGEPAIILAFEGSVEDGKSSSRELWIMRVNSARQGDCVGWLVRYLIRDQPESHVLKADSNYTDRFAVYELCGALEHIQVQCVVTQEKVEPAVEWFLREGSNNPDLRWVSFGSSVSPV